MSDKPHIEQLAVVVKLSDGTVRQVALTREQAAALIQMLPSFFNGSVKILPGELSLTLESYKNNNSE